MYCANNQIITPDILKTPLVLEINSTDGPVFIKTEPLIVKNLCCPIILGLDLLNDLQINSTSDFVVINGKRIKTVYPDLNEKSNVKVNAIVQIDLDEENEKNL